jgi:hypothetical protein
MAIFSVSVYSRITDANGKRRYAQADHRKLYPDGTIFVLRYEVAGKRGGSFGAHTTKVVGP